MNIGNGWSGTTKKGEACIDLQLDGIFALFFPWLKNLRFRMTYISSENRTDEKSPDWVISTYPKQENTNNANASAKAEELVKQAAVSDDEANARMAEAAEYDRVG